MIKIPVSEEEAWYVGVRPHSDEWKKVHLVDRGTSEFRMLMEEVAANGYSGVTFYFGDDPIAFAKVNGCWAPWDIENSYRREGLYTLEFEGATWRRIQPDNSSYWQHRIADHVPDEYALIERALAEQWKHENEQRPGLNYGQGILQDLMLSTAHEEKPEGFRPWLTNRERKIVATVIQWLGTNIGRSFLYEASKRMGRAQWPFEKPKPSVEPQLTEALALIRKHQFCKTDGKDNWWWCPECGQEQTSGHTSACRIGKLLKP